MKTFLILIFFNVGFFFCCTSYSAEFENAGSRFEKNFVNWPYKEDKVIFGTSLGIAYVAILPVDICSSPFYAMYALFNKNKNSYGDVILYTREKLLNEYIRNIGFPIYCLVSTALKVPKFILWDMPSRLFAGKNHRRPTEPVPEKKKWGQVDYSSC